MATQPQPGELLPVGIDQASAEAGEAGGETLESQGEAGRETVGSQGEAGEAEPAGQPNLISNAYRLPIFSLAC
jgi:hypothetical protein